MQSIGLIKKFRLSSRDGKLLCKLLKGSAAGEGLARKGSATFPNCKSMSYLFLERKDMQALEKALPYFSQGLPGLRELHLKTWGDE